MAPADDPTAPAVMPTPAPTESAPAAPAPLTILTPEAMQPKVIETPAPEAKAPEPAKETPAEPALKLHTETPTLLEEVKADVKPPEKPAEEKKPDEPKAEEKKPDEAKAPDDPKKEEVKPPEEKKPEEVKPPPPTYETLKIPEGVKLDDAQVGEFKTKFGELGVAPEAAQWAMDKHVAEMKRYDHSLRQAQHDQFAETRRGWTKQALADPEFGGAAWETNKTQIAQMRDMLVEPDHRDAFAQFLKDTGAGDHPEFLRVFHRAARYFAEAPQRGDGIKPPPDIGKAPKQVGRRGTLYNHPTSVAKRGA